MADFQENIDSGKRMDYDYSKEDYRFRARIISSEYAQRCIELVNQYDFSQSCKITLGEIISVNFDSNAVLARNLNLTIRMIDLKISLNLAVTAMDISDTANPGLLNVIQAIEVAFSDFSSRSLGGKERDQIGKTETVNQQNYTGLAGPQQEPSRGFKLPWGGNKQ
jgi:hypothetical protein